MTPARRLAPAAFVALAAAGGALALAATRNGVGLMPDSADYFSAARNIAAGKGLVVTGTGGATGPLILWPPLYPALLALGSWFGLALETAARWVGALSSAATVLAAALLARATTRSTAAGLLSGLLVLTASALAEVQSWAQSEGVFIALALFALLLIENFRKSGDRRRLVAAALVVGLACLARYGGVALVLAGAVALLVDGRRPARARFADAGMFLLLAGAPLALWLVRNSIVAASAVARPLLFHLPPGWKWLAGLDTITRWLLPHGAPGWLRWPALGTALAASIALAVTARRAREKGTTPPLAALLFIPAWLLTAVASITFLDAFIPLDGRLLAPLLPVGIVLAVHLGFSAASTIRQRSRLRPALVAGAAVWLLLSSVVTARWLAHRSADGAWYSSAEWRESSVIAAARAVPARVGLYSNVPEGIWLITGRDARALPARYDHHAARENPRYLAQVDSLRALLAEEEAVVVYVGLEAARRWYLPSERELVARLALAPLRRARDGTVYVSARGPLSPPSP